MKKSNLLFAILFLVIILPGCSTRTETPIVSTPDAKLFASVYHSGFEHSGHSYNGLYSASDGKIYYVLCSEGLIDIAAQMYSFDPNTKKIEHLGDLTEMCGEKDMKVVAQGKSHVQFYESNGILYFATHLAYYSVDAMEKPGIPTKGFKPYRGGHILAYDMKNKTSRDLGIAHHNEGILTLNMDTRRGLIYGITWPTGYLFRYDVAKEEMKEIGPYTGKGETGLAGIDYQVLCRSIALNPDDGSIYVTNEEGQIKRLKAGQDTLETLAGEEMKKDYFGQYQRFTVRNYGYNWRQIFWYPSEKMFYGVHGQSGYLFRFNPAIPRIEVLERLTSIPSKFGGMFDKLIYGYLGFTLGPDGRTIYYLTGGPIYTDGARLKDLENIHLITYDVPTSKYFDHGVIFTPDSLKPIQSQGNSIAVGDNGTVYTFATANKDGQSHTDLISIPNPLMK